MSCVSVPMTSALKEEEEMFYLTTHSTHWLEREILKVSLRDRGLLHSEDTYLLMANL